jgi:hypothetical protein
MHRRTIQRIFPVPDPQKSGSLLECLFAEAFDLAKLRS